MNSCEEVKFVMSWDRYYELRRNIIVPALDELVEEYRGQGYECYKSYEEIMSLSEREAISGMRDKPVVSSVKGQISIVRSRNGYDRIVTIFYGGDAAIGVKLIGSISAAYIPFGEVTPERVVGEIRDKLG